MAGFGWADSSATLDFSALGLVDSLSIPKNEHTHLVWHNIRHQYNFEDEYMLIKVGTNSANDKIVHIDSCSSQKKIRYENSFVLETGKGESCRWGW